MTGDAVAVSEAVLEKAVRYLAEGKLTVTRMDGSIVTATCEGGGSYALTARWDGVYRCDCPATGVCSHMLALNLVTGRGPNA